MASVLDVAAYILKEHGPMTAMKLQKLCYYAKAWHLVWAERPLFDERIEAWANGPVSPRLYREHKGKFSVAPGDIAGDVSALDERERGSIDGVVNFYNPMSAYELSELTHLEDPWKEARGAVPAGSASTAPITEAAMAEYYGSLV